MVNKVIIIAAVLAASSGMVFAQAAAKKEGGKMDAETKVLTGQCHCGDCKYEYKGAIVKCSYCDCLSCRKATGALKAPWVTVMAASFTMKSGEPRKYNNPQGGKCDKHGEFYFCPKCGSPIYWKGFKGAELDILAGTLDDAKIFTAKE